jgi:hypothetical protein
MITNVKIASNLTAELKMKSTDLWKFRRILLFYDTSFFSFGRPSSSETPDSLS